MTVEQMARRNLLLFSQCRAGACDRTEAMSLLMFTLLETPIFMSIGVYDYFYSSNENRPVND